MRRFWLLFLGFLLVLAGCGRITVLPLSPSRSSSYAAKVKQSNPDLNFEVTAKDSLKVTVTNNTGTDMYLVKILEGSTGYADLQNFTGAALTSSRPLRGLPLDIGKLRTGESVQREVKVDTAPPEAGAKTPCVSLRLTWETGMDSREFTYYCPLDDSPE
jgi:hypothetical protein